MKALLKKGLSDSVLQIAATTLVRLGLVLSVIILAPLVGLKETGRFDLFIIAATMFQLAVTVGLDSGLAVVSQRHVARLRQWFLIAALVILCALALSFLALLEIALIPESELKRNASLARMSWGYGVLSGAMILIFSWYRWQSQARVASILLVGANSLSFCIAGLGFAIFRSIEAFVAGLLVGGVFGVLICLHFIFRYGGFDAARGGQMFTLWRSVPIIRGLLLISLPYLIASVSLILRRLVDRAFILTLGDPKLIGAYAVVARIAEMLAFGLNAPSIGFAPLLVDRYREESVRRLGRILYLGYVCTAFVIVSGTFLSLPIYREFEADRALLSLVPMSPAIVAGTLFLGENSIAAFGFILARKPTLFTAFSIGYIVFYSALVVLLFSIGSGVNALAWAFAIASFLYSSLTVVFSERLRPFKYNLKIVIFIKMATLCVAIIPLLP